ncbi:MAG: sensor histidine kinase [Alphaproteobacteria bacterium]
MTESKLRLPPPTRSLSARLLVLTIFFVMVAEVLIYAPSIGRYRKMYLDERIGASHLATLALEAASEHKVSAELEVELLAHAGVRTIELRNPGLAKQLMLGPAVPPAIDSAFDLREGTFVSLIADALAALGRGGERVIHVTGQSPKDSRVIVEVVMDEAPMRAAMVDFSERILALSLVISVITAALVYASLRLLMVNPMRRLTEAITVFRADPESASAVIVPGTRTDEIGVAQRALRDMQTGLLLALHERARLAALGAAVARISHDLRNILSTTRLVSDRIARLDDPEVRRMAPTLVSSIDRAVTLCVDTLEFARAEKPINPTQFALRDLAEDVARSLGLAMRTELAWQNEIPQALAIEADRDQLFRVLANLATNAFEAGAKRVRLSAALIAGGVSIELADDGPGLPPRVRERLFEPFAPGRPGGSGLGLAIARELMRAHDGDAALESTGAEGTVFKLFLPERRPAAE